MIQIAMTDREKVIKKFALFIKEFHPACTSEGVELDMFREVLAVLNEQKELLREKEAVVPLAIDDAVSEIMDKNYKRLKEQEPIEPVDDGHGSLICGNQGFGCGCVGRYDLTTKVVEKYCNFCPECGRKVKWG